MSHLFTDSQWVPNAGRGRAIPQHVIKIHARVVAPAAGRSLDLPPILENSVLFYPPGYCWLPSMVMVAGTMHPVVEA